MVLLDTQEFLVTREFLDSQVSPVILELLGLVDSQVTRVLVLQVSPVILELLGLAGFQGIQVLPVLAAILALVLQASQVIQEFPVLAVSRVIQEPELQASQVILEPELQASLVILVSVLQDSQVIPVSEPLVSAVTQEFLASLVTLESDYLDTAARQVSQVILVSLAILVNKEPLDILELLE